MRKTIDRLMQYIEYTGLSARKFDLSIGAGNGYTLRMLKNNASIGSDVIETISRIYPELNLVWLITGEGEMLKKREQALTFEFNDLPKERQKAIEHIIEQKIKEHQENELKHLLKEVTQEIERSQEKLNTKA
jgi:hypothetical protein